jgi:hypothetical protein
MTPTTTTTTTPTPRRHPTRGDAPRILILHGPGASPAARKLARELGGAGYRVGAAPSATFDKATAADAPDVVVALAEADAALASPELRAGRVGVVVVVAGDMDGAAVIATVDAALAAPFAVLSTVRNTPTEVSAAFADIDMDWLFRGACETHRAIALVAADGTRMIRVSFLEGLVADAEVRDTADHSGKRVAAGIPALLEFLACADVDGARFSVAPLTRHPQRLLWLSWAAVQAQLAAAPRTTQKREPALSPAASGC